MLIHELSISLFFENAKNTFLKSIYRTLVTLVMS